MTKKILSIQSHVVSGYVGNKSATFPLQLLGYEIDPLNSVQFSNHTGYAHGWKGDVLDVISLKNLFQGLINNDLISYDYLLTGYIGNPDFLLEIPNIYNTLKSQNPNIKFVCDPVLGDNGKLYVPETLIPIYKNVILPLADIITPNQFEAEILSGIKIYTEDDIKEIMNFFYAFGIKLIVISSCELENMKNLNLYVAQYYQDLVTTVSLSFPKIDSVFVGTGDLFCALFLAWNDKHPQDLKLVCDKVVSSMQALLKKTHEYYLKNIKDDESAKLLELRLIQNPQDILDPKIIYNSKKEDIHL